MNMNVDTDGPQRILIVDDERVNVLALHGLLQDEYKVMVAADGPRALQAAVSQQPDLILLDVRMPGMDGFEVCARLKADPVTSSIPVIFITALDDAEDETRGLELGASDYIAKPFNPMVVWARVRTQLRLKRQNDLLERYAFRDGLTGIPNRRAFDDRSGTEWSRCLRARQSLAVALIDVDHFKAYNDHHGHLRGDDCLRQVADCLVGGTRRSGDLVARYGGEEFVVCMPNTPLEGALAVAEGLREAIAAAGLPHGFSPVASHVTVSVGVAALVPERVARLPDLMTEADRMLYASKAAGRNRVTGTELRPADRTEPPDA